MSAGLNKNNETKKIDFEFNDIIKNDVFVSKKDGFPYFRIPAIMYTPNGTLLAACEARLSLNDWSTTAIVQKRSTDKGLSWSPINIVVGKKCKKNEWRNDKSVTFNNPVYLLDDLAELDDSETMNSKDQSMKTINYRIHLLHCVGYERVFHLFSDDDGKTYSKPVEITSIFEKFRDTYDWNVVAVGPGKGIQLHFKDADKINDTNKGNLNGRLIVPIWIAFGKGRKHHPNACGVIYSDDHGETWQAGDLVPIPEGFNNFNETQAVQLSNGNVYLNIRNESSKPFRVFSVSEDGAHNWSKPKFIKDLYEPICMGSMYSFKNLIFFTQPSPIESKFSSNNIPMDLPVNRIRSRKFLSLKASINDGKSWKFVMNIEKGKSAYSDIIADEEGNLYCLYERAKKFPAIHPYQRISIAIIKKDAWRRRLDRIFR